MSELVKKWHCDACGHDFNEPDWLIEEGKNESENPICPECGSLNINLTLCGMGGCDHRAYTVLEINEHEAPRFDMGLPPKITKLPVCRYHSLIWRLGWLLAEHGFARSFGMVNEAIHSLHIYPGSKPEP